MQQAKNLKKMRYEGSTEEKFKQTMSSFLKFHKNKCLVIQDSEDVLHGVVFVNSAQIEMYKMWGECLIFDWTHNTNNCGYYLGKKNLYMGLSFSLFFVN